MLKSLLALLGIVLLFTTSCKKESKNDGNTDYYVKIKKNGAWVSFPAVAGELGPDLGNSALIDLGVTAASTNGNERFDLTVQLSGTTFPIGTYTSDNPNYQTDVTFVLDNAADLSYYDIGDAPNLAPSKYTINITAITAETLTGTFTGNYLYDSFANTGAVVNITEGEFYVKRIR